MSPASVRGKDFRHVDSLHGDIQCLPLHPGDSWPQADRSCPMHLFENGKEDIVQQGLISDEEQVKCALDRNPLAGRTIAYQTPIIKKSFCPSLNLRNQTADWHCPNYFNTSSWSSACQWRFAIQIFHEMMQRRPLGLTNWSAHSSLPDYQMILLHLWSATGVLVLVNHPEGLVLVNPRIKPLQILVRNL